MYHVPNLARAKRIQQQAAELMTLNEEALRKDYYKLLGLERRRQTDDEISAAFKEKMIKYHPDKYSDKERAHQMVEDITAVNLA
jgi:DnaJ-domain-containing protein 1